MYLILIFSLRVFFSQDIRLLDITNWLELLNMDKCRVLLFPISFPVRGKWKAKMRHILFCPLRDQNLMKSITLEILWKPSFVSFITLEFLSSRAFNQLLFWYLTSGIQYLQDYTKEKEYFQIARLHKRKRIFSNHCHTKSFIWYQSTKEKKDVFSIWLSFTCL